MKLIITYPDMVAKILKDLIREGIQFEAILNSNGETVITFNGSY